MVAVTEWVWLGPILGLAVIWFLPFAYTAAVFALTAIAAAWELLRGTGRVMGLPIRERESWLWRWVDGL